MFLLRIFAPFAFGYFLSQLLRSVNAIIASDLVVEMSLDASILGLLTSAYFFAFALAQLPVGLALDRFGPRRTEALLLVVAAAGSFLFATAESVHGLIIGRALIGLGVSACLMASFKAFVVWAPTERLPFLNGAVMTAGALGSLTATAPVEWALSLTDWRGVFEALAIASFVIATLIVFLVREKRTPGSRESFGESFVALKAVFTSRVFWSIVPLSVAHQGTYLSIQSLWAGPWLRDVAELDRTGVAENLLVLAVGMALGFLTFGYLSGRLERQGVPILTTWVCAHLVFLGAQLGLVLQWVHAAILLWFAFGFFGATGMLSYVILTKRFPFELAGRVNTSLNLIVFSGAFLFQSGVGAIIHAVGNQTAERYSPAGYRLAFGVVLLIEISALAWLLATAKWRKLPTGCGDRTT